MAKQKLEIIDNLEVANAGIVKRMAALLIDASLTVVLIYLLSFIVHPILNATSNYDARFINEERETKRSHLVTLSEEVTWVELGDDDIADRVKITNNSVPFYEYAEATYNFYTVYLNSKVSDPAELITDEWYIDNILKVDEDNSPLKRVEIPDENGRKYASVTSDTSEAVEPEFDPFLVAGTTYKVAEPEAKILNDFYRKIYSEAIKLFESRASYKELKTLISIDNMIRVVVSSSIIFLTLPLFLSYGQTLGKKALKLGLSTTYGYQISWIQLLVRYFVFLAVNLLSNFLIPVIGPFISLTVMVFNRRAKSLHDFAAGTRVVDLGNSEIYLNVQAYQQALKSRTLPSDNKVFNEEVFADRFSEDSGA